MHRAVDRRVWLVAGLHVVLLLALAGRYGFHRDELYFLEAGRHLAFGYVDQPPLVPALARMQAALFGPSVAAVRIVPALVSGVSVMLGGVIARELGGGSRAQVLSAGAVAGAGFVLSVGHLLSTPTIDFAVWLGLLAVFVRLLRTGEPRWWLLYGLIAGVGLWNKHLVVLLTVSILVGLVVSRRWDLLASRWLAVGGVIALVIASPTLVWQMLNGWPQLQLADALSERLGTENRLMLLPLQLVMLSPLLVPFAWAGGVLLWTAREGAPTLRPILWAYVAALVLTFLTGGRPYYPLPIAAVLVIAGLVASERQPSRSEPALVVAAALFSVPIALPVLPAGWLAGSPVTVVNDTLVEQVGWRDLAQTVQEVVASLPDQDGVVIVTGTYGEAGALDRYGPDLGLPPVYSGHNSYWHWRQPDDDDATVVTVRMAPAVLAQHFTECEAAAQIANRHGVENEAHGASVRICHGLRGSWETQWPAFRHYG